jgi:hypothetical protein
VPEEGEREVGGGPADGLEREEADERAERGVVGLPPEEEAGCKAQALGTGEQALMGGCGVS